MEDPVDTKWLQDSLVEDFAEARKTWDGPLPSKTFTIPSQDLLNPLKVYMSNAIILFFPGKMPSANDVAQWINAMFKVYAVSGVYFAARGFYEVLLSELKYKIQLLEDSPLKYRDQMVHVEMKSSCMQKSINHVRALLCLKYHKQIIVRLA